MTAASPGHSDDQQVTSAASRNSKPQRENKATMEPPAILVSDTRGHLRDFPDAFEDLQIDDDDDDYMQLDWDRCESEENQLAKSLKSWMPEYTLRSLRPQPQPPKQPVFSARLGDQMKIKRSDSSESVNTLLSLFSCSSHGSRTTIQKRRRLRKKRVQEAEEKPDDGPSIWVKLASKSHSATLNRMFQKHAVYAFQVDTETEIFKALPEEEQDMVTKAGYNRGVHLGPGLQRSDSASNVHNKFLTEQPKRKSVQRLQSAGGKHEGPMLNFQEIRRQIVNQRLHALSHHGRTRSRRSMGGRSLSRQSIASIGSNDAFMSTPPRMLSPIDKEENTEPENQVSVWKGDAAILAIDLKRELTAKVKDKITTTTTALERCTGVGDDNEPRTFVGTLEEYPLYVDEDYGRIAKIPQRIRISPSLSTVIRTDIHVRMGRPRYHEIREDDLSQWNKGQHLDRSHRNLKVFNWLHSLRESDFDMTRPEAVVDMPPGGDVTTKDEVVVSVDEPKIKPLFERLKTQYIV